MAMKVTKATIQRLTVEMSCGCKMFREFKDARFKEAEGDNRFTACEKHRADPSVSMLEFILGERVDEAAEEASKAPTFAPRQIEEGDSGGVIATGESVQRMGMNMPKRNPLEAKKLERTHEQLKSAGAAGSGKMAEVDMQTEEVPEDSRVTDLMDSTLDFLATPDEKGLFDDEG
jgi:hypothetical protein